MCCLSILNEPEWHYFAYFVEMSNSRAPKYIAFNLDCLEMSVNIVYYESG